LKEKLSISESNDTLQRKQESEDSLIEMARDMKTLIDRKNEGKASYVKQINEVLF
jgi:hypothetical protein